MQSHLSQPNRHTHQPKINVDVDYIVCFILLAIQSHVNFYVFVYGIM